MIQNEELLRLYMKMIAKLDSARTAEEQVQIMKDYMQLSYECGRKSINTTI